MGVELGSANDPPEEIYAYSKAQPLRLREGQAIGSCSARDVERVSERYATIRLVADRKLFGLVVRVLDLDFYTAMGINDGVLIAHEVPTTAIAPDAKLPGDIDLLVLPYAGDKVILSKILAIELKVVRASYLKQNRSPNALGLSQAEALLQLGFPYVAVVHLIVSDRSPREAWRPVLQAVVADADSGRLANLTSTHTDMLPSDLIDRCLGRLIHARRNSSIGLVAAYLSKEIRTIRVPDGAAAVRNPKASIVTMNAVKSLYEREPLSFLETRAQGSPST